MSAAPATIGPASANRSGSWLISPAVDLVCLANWGWLLALVPASLDFDGQPRLQFWQIYFLTTPHRWITLALVALDPARRHGRERTLVAWAVGAAVVVAGTFTVTGAFTCLALVDYLWNAWHFAAQHAGVLRIYARRAGGAHPRHEVPLLRALVVYVALRLAGWTTGWIESVPSAGWILGGADALALAAAAVLILTALGDWARGRVAKSAYALSVAGLYAALLGAVAGGASGLVARLTTAAAVFHALEYLTLVTHYAEGRRRATETPRRAAWPTIGLVAAFALALGLIGYWATAQTARWWLGLNLWAACLHYAYDGMIWKLRDPATAAALGAVPGTPTALATGPTPPGSVEAAPPRTLATGGIS